MLRWHFMHSQCCAITTSVWFQNISITPREFLYSLTATLPPFPTVARNYQSAFCLYGFVCSKRFVYMEPDSVGPPMSGFFHSA